MKIIGNNNQVLDAITLCLTPTEAKELAHSAADLAEHPEKHHHHVSSADYQVEITVAVYTVDNIADFSEDLQRILKVDPKAD